MVPGFPPLVGLGELGHHIIKKTILIMMAPLPPFLILLFEIYDALRLGSGSFFPPPSAPTQSHPSSTQPNPNLTLNQPNPNLYPNPLLSPPYPTYLLLAFRWSSRGGSKSPINYFNNINNYYNNFILKIYIIIGYRPKLLHCASFL